MSGPVAREHSFRAPRSAALRSSSGTAAAQRQAGPRHHRGLGAVELAKLTLCPPELIAAARASAPSSSTPKSTSCCRNADECARVARCLERRPSRCRPSASQGGEAQTTIAGAGARRSVFPRRQRASGQSRPMILRISAVSPAFASQEQIIEAAAAPCPVVHEWVSGELMPEPRRVAHTQNTRTLWPPWAVERARWIREQLDRGASLAQLAELVRHGLGVPSAPILEADAESEFAHAMSGESEAGEGVSNEHGRDRTSRIARDPTGQPQPPGRGAPALRSRSSVPVPSSAPPSCWASPGTRCGAA